jgi:hypothetical protein
MLPHAEAAVTISTYPGMATQRQVQPHSACAHLAHYLSILERFAPIDLSQMDAVALMDRVDTKYVLSATQLPSVLAALVADYRVLQACDERLTDYCTLYFDTCDLALYTDHHMAKSERYKVRSRAYLDSGVSYLEIKRKTNKGRTIKERIRTNTLLTHLTPEASQFVDEMTPCGAHALEGKLWCEFSRITLVSKNSLERASFDVDLSYRLGDSFAWLGGVIVAEVKQENLDRDSALMRQMRTLGIHPVPFSKYCIGMAMLNPGIKHNRFKPILSQVEHIMRGSCHA